MRGTQEQLSRAVYHVDRGDRLHPPPHQSHALPTDNLLFAHQLQERKSLKDPVLINDRQDHTRPNNTNAPFPAGLIGMGEPDSLVTASAALNAFHVPVVAVNPGFYSGAGGQVVKLY